MFFSFSAKPDIEHALENNIAISLLLLKVKRAIFLWYWLGNFHVFHLDIIFNIFCNEQVTLYNRL